MIKILLALAMAGAMATAVLIGGCTQMPTEKQGVSDMRPQISFKTDDAKLHGARVLLDGLDMGAVGDYADGAATLRILPGTHLLQIAASNGIVLEEKFYLGDGANRAFILK
jgi:hypothetical protein